MTERSILAVPGLKNTSSLFRYELWEMANRNGWNVDAIAAVMSMESGFNPTIKNPHGTASGLIQMIDSTAKSVGIEGGAAELRTLSDVEQLPYIERYYLKAFAGFPVENLRNVDYYVVGMGQRPGLKVDYVLVDRDTKPEVYAMNSALDVDNDGKITVKDLAAHMARRMNAPQGERLSAEPPKIEYLGSPMAALGSGKPDFASPILPLALLFAGGYAYYSRLKRRKSAR